MDESQLIPIAIGGAVIVMIGLLGFVFSKSVGTQLEQRLEGLTGKGKKANKLDPAAGILMRPPAIDLASSDFWSKWIPNLDNLNLLYEQADVMLPFKRFMAIVAGLSLTGAAIRN